MTSKPFYLCSNLESPESILHMSEYGKEKKSETAIYSARPGDAHWLRLADGRKMEYAGSNRWIFINEYDNISSITIDLDEIPPI